MNDNAKLPGHGADDDSAADGPGGRLAAYEARTENALDLCALLTLWIVVVPPGDFGHNVAGIVWTVRIAVSVVYGIDLAIRGALAGRPVRYALAHPAMLVSVVFPPVRVIFSFRLVRSVFRRGHLGRFLAAASALVLNGAAIVYLFERHAPKSNIHTLGESVWWSLVTVTSVGYGDYTPVTVPGRVTACFVMGIGLLTLAVVTAQVASSFVAQGPGEAPPVPQAEPAPEVTLAELGRRLARIEKSSSPPPPRRHRRERPGHMSGTQETTSPDHRTWAGPP